MATEQMAHGTRTAAHHSHNHRAAAARREALLRKACSMQKSWFSGMLAYLTRCASGAELRGRMPYCLLAFSMGSSSQTALRAIAAKNAECRPSKKHAK